MRHAVCLGHTLGEKPVTSKKGRARKNYEIKREQTKSCIFGQLIGQYALPVLDRARGDGA
jgi:hypothetical protein